MTAKNTDRELWRDGEDYYAPSIHVTEQGLIGINVGGTVILKTLEEWHRLATNGGWINPTIQPPPSSSAYWCVIEDTEDEYTYEGSAVYDKPNNLWLSGEEEVKVLSYMPLMGIPELLKR